jgi:hypothetical protein
MGVTCTFSLCISSYVLMSYGVYYVWVYLHDVLFSIVKLLSVSICVLEGKKSVIGSIAGSLPAGTTP